MTRNAAYTSVLCFFFAQLVFGTNISGQTRPDQFIFPQGWTLVDNWVTPFQQTFGLGTDMEEFFALQSESDFLLYNAEKNAFLVIWAEPASPHEIYTGLNQLITQPVWGLKTTGMQATEFMFPFDPAQENRLHMTLLSPKGHNHTNELPTAVRLLADTWKPDTSRVYGATLEGTYPAVKE